MKKKLWEPARFDVPEGWVEHYCFACEYIDLERMKMFLLWMQNNTDGFVGIRNEWPLGCLIIYKTLNDAKRARNKADMFKNHPKLTEVCGDLWLPPEEEK